MVKILANIINLHCRIFKCINYFFLFFPRIIFLVLFFYKKKMIKNIMSYNKYNKIINFKFNL